MGGTGGGEGVVLKGQLGDFYPVKLRVYCGNQRGGFRTRRVDLVRRSSDDERCTNRQAAVSFFDMRCDASLPVF